MLKSIIFVIVLVSVTLCTAKWPNHDISTLKLLQIVHRHGDRANIKFVPNDPYSSEAKYWPEGLGQLDTRGKYRMFKIGQFIRQEYNDYFGDQYSPREVYARSSLSERCVESLSVLLAGAYPPKQKVWQWNSGSDAQLGQLWQPFPIQTFMPDTDDLVLDDRRQCKSINAEIVKINNRSEVINFLKNNKEFYANLSKISGKTINSINTASSLCTELEVEVARGLYWNQVWTKEQELEVLKQLEPIQDLRYKHGWDSPVIQRLRSGGLVRELNNNLQKVLNKDRDVKKLYVYSTHDTLVASLLGGLNIFNDRAPPFGAALFLELHETSGQHFVRAYYHNETDVNGYQGVPHSLQWGNCRSLKDCPISEYLNSTKYLLYDNFNKECNP